MSALQQTKGSRPTLGGRSHRCFVACYVSQANLLFGSRHQQCALPGGGSGAARGAPGRNSFSEGSSLTIARSSVNPLLTLMFRARNICPVTTLGGPQ